MSTTALDSMPHGATLPTLELLDVVTQKKVMLLEMVGSFSTGLLVIILCRHCPYVEHVLEELKNMASVFMPQGISFVGISANDPVQYPEDAPERLREMVSEKKIPFPILFDETQDFVKALQAVCTPDFFLFGKKNSEDFHLTYHGRLDASTPKNGAPLTGADLRAALESVCRGEALAEHVPQSLGCSIKWKPH